MNHAFRHASLDMQRKVTDMDSNAPTTDTRTNAQSAELTPAKPTKRVKFELKADGTVERVGPFGSCGPTLMAATKTEAISKFLAFAFRASENTPKVKVRNGAYQLAYESLSYGINVESGVEGREQPLCFSGAKDWRSLNDDIASFEYYASSTYRDNMLASAA